MQVESQIALSRSHATGQFTAYERIESSLCSSLGHTKRHDVMSLPQLFAFLGSVLLAAYPALAAAETFAQQLAGAAMERTHHQVTYDGSYRRIDYPNGDVPQNIGVCTDVVVRSYRAAGIDLQASVHEDMRAHFEVYPSKRIWGLTRPDSNIDHRRVPNLQVFFERKGQKLPASENPAAYTAGDIVTWMLPGNLPHIGIVSNKRDPETNQPLVIHNIGRGPKLEDALFSYKITGHYRYGPE